jgi:hypothetical protein
VRQFLIALITVSGRGSHGLHWHDAASIRVPKDIRNLQNRTSHDRCSLCGGGSPLGSSFLTLAARGGCWPAVGRTRIDPDRFDHNTRCHIRKRERVWHSKSDLVSSPIPSCCVIGHFLEREHRYARQEPASGHLGVYASMCARPFRTEKSVSVSARSALTFVSSRKCCRPLIRTVAEHAYRWARYSA